ncbi:CPBP family intramembrane glutamic endopeptidase [Urinicoccus massiliensis]|uniref:CPBP family intramembrane glutamic endopeptidase n=1 Tax=Urinicoccus massiliensis TaxID=1723382 RepID=UPI000930E691|nr:type II CAAX endopeptidase family protein [Urinicoccus massiliensis]
MTQSKKQALIFLLTTYLLPFLLGGLIYYGKSKGLDISLLPAFQMLTPALAVSLIILNGRKERNPKVKRAFLTYVFFTGLFLLASIASLFMKNLPQNVLVIVFSLAFLVAIVSMPKDLRKAYGLDLSHKKRILGVLGIFLVLYLLRGGLGSLAEKNFQEFLTYLTWNKLVFVLALVVNFPLSFIFFFGEEFGWRFYLQPLLQKKFGMVQGTLLLGLAWGIWHLPLNLFFYSAPGSGLMSLVNQLFVCVSYGIFFSFAYNYSKSLWTPVLLHYFNNNLILLFSKNMDPSIIENQVLTWPSVLVTGLLMLVLFGSFILSPYNRKPLHRRPDLEEIQEEIEKLEVPHENMEK